MAEKDLKRDRSTVTPPRGRIPPGFDLPLEYVRLEQYQEREGDTDLMDYLLVEECPLCGRTHRYDCFMHPEVLLGGVSRVTCVPRIEGEYDHLPRGFYIMLKDHGLAVPYENIHIARQKVVEFSGEELQQPLIPEEVDPQALDSVFWRWTSSK